jgi:hypothetical protein
MVDTLNITYSKCRVNNNITCVDPDTVFMSKIKQDANLSYYGLKAIIPAAQYIVFNRCHTPTASFGHVVRGQAHGNLAYMNQFLLGTSDIPSPGIVALGLWKQPLSANHNLVKEMPEALKVKILSQQANHINLPSC